MTTMERDGPEALQCLPLGKKPSGCARWVRTRERVPGGIEINSLLKAMDLEDIQLLKAGLIKEGPIHGGTNCMFRPVSVPSGVGLIQGQRSRQHQ